MDKPSASGHWLRSLGPAIIVAAVVCGPGSILNCSKVGARFEYQALWVLAVAGALMFATTVLAGRIGLAYQRTPCDELASRLGRWAAVVVGTVLFLLIACFQSSNNVALIWGLEPLIGNSDPEGKVAIPGWAQVAVILATTDCASSRYTVFDIFMANWRS